MQLTITDQASAVLNALGAKLAHPQPVYEAAALAIASLTQRSFVDASVRAVPWIPLDPSTIKGKRRATFKSAILRRSGLLFKSWLATASDAEGTVATDRPYAVFHQFGTRRLPMRPMLPIIGSASAPQLTQLAVRDVTEAAIAAFSAIIGTS